MPDATAHRRGTRTPEPVLAPPRRRGRYGLCGEPVPRPPSMSDDPGAPIAAPPDVFPAGLAGPATPSGYTDGPSPSPLRAPTPYRRRRLLVAGGVLVVLLLGRAIAAAVHDANQPATLDTSQMPVTTLSLGHLATLTNPLDLGLERASVTRVQVLDHAVGSAQAPAAGTSYVVVSVNACTDGTWRPDGVVAFSLLVPHGHAVQPQPTGALPMLSSGVGSSSGCHVGFVTYSVRRGVAPVGVSYLLAPYRSVEWKP